MILTEACFERTPDQARNFFSGGMPTAAGVCVGHEEDSGRKRPHFTVAALKGRRPGLLMHWAFALHTAKSI